MLVGMPAKEVHTRPARRVPRQKRNIVKVHCLSARARAMVRLAESQARPSETHPRVTIKNKLVHLSMPEYQMSNDMSHTDSRNLYFDHGSFAWSRTSIVNAGGRATHGDQASHGVCRV